MLQRKCTRELLLKQWMWGTGTLHLDSLFLSVGNRHGARANYELGSSIFSSTQLDYQHSTSLNKIFDHQIMSFLLWNLGMHEIARRTERAKSRYQGWQFPKSVLKYWSNLYSWNIPPTHQLLEAYAGKLDRSLEKHRRCTGTSTSRGWTNRSRHWSGTSADNKRLVLEWI